MKINARGINYQFADSDGSTKAITVNLSGTEASDYINGSLVITASDLTDGTTLDSLNKMEAYVKATLGEA